MLSLVQDPEISPKTATLDPMSFPLFFSGLFFFLICITGSVPPGQATAAANENICGSKLVLYHRYIFIQWKDYCVMKKAYSGARGYGGPWTRTCIIV